MNRDKIMSIVAYVCVILLVFGVGYLVYSQVEKELNQEIVENFPIEEGKTLYVFTTKYSISDVIYIKVFNKNSTWRELNQFKYNIIDNHILIIGSVFNRGDVLLEIKYRPTLTATAVVYKEVKR